MTFSVGYWNQLEKFIKKLDKISKGRIEKAIDKRERVY